MKQKSSLKKLSCIGYCGLYCPECCKIKIAFLAKQLLNELKSAQDKGVKISQDFFAIKPILEKLITLECKKFCREGGGKSVTCSIKACCIEHGINGCWECLGFDFCKKLKPQFLENNKKLREMNIEEYIRQYK